MDDDETQGVPHAKLVKGIWFPEHDKHLTGMVENNSKVGEVTLGDGRRVGTYQKHKLDFAMERLAGDRRRTAVDVGGHIGMWSMHLADLFRHVEAFEPLQMHWRLFEVNLNRNPRVKLNPVGLGSKRDEVEIVVDPMNTGNAHIVGKDEDALEAVANDERLRLGIIEPDANDPDDPRKIHTETIPIRTLDSYGLEDVDFIKIDVEGTELAVVQGARRTILRCKPMIIVEQKNNDVKFHGGEANAASKYLQKHGMRLIRDYGGDHVLDWPK